MCKGKKNCSCGCSTKKKSLKESLDAQLESKLENDYNLIKQGEVVVPENEVERNGYQKLQNDGYLDYDTEVEFDDDNGGQRVQLIIILIMGILIFLYLIFLHILMMIGNLKILKQKYSMQCKEVFLSQNNQIKNY